MGSTEGPLVDRAARSQCRVRFFFSIQSGFFECGRKLDSFFTITDFFCKLFSSFRARYRVASLCMLIVKRFFLV